MHQKMSVSMKRMKKKKKRNQTQIWGNDKSLYKMKISLKECNSRFGQEESAYFKKRQMKLYGPEIRTKKEIRKMKCT